MATVSEALKKAASQIGVTEVGYSNKVKYNTWFYGRAVSGSAYPWCAVWTSWVADQVGMKKDVDYPHSAGVAVQFAWFIRKGRKVSKYNLKPGDWVRYTFSHVGIVEKVLSGNRVQTIEGNTSGSNAGSQRDGGGVHRRIRSLSIIQYGGRPNYTGKSSGGTSSDKKEGGLFGMSLLKPLTRQKDLALPKGKWRTIPTDDKDNTSIVSGLKPGDDIMVNLNLGLSGLPKGSEAQVRIYTVSYKKGTKTRRLSTHYAEEIVGTSGGTFGAVTFLRKNTHKAASGRSIRIRAEIQVFQSGVKITRAQFQRAKG